MIIHDLVNLYNQLLKSGKIAKPGWQSVAIGYALVIDAAGNVIDLIPLYEEVARGNKTVLLPKKYTMPARTKKASGVAADYIANNAKYILGIASSDANETDEKRQKNIKRAQECFLASKSLHHQILDGVEDEFAHAILRFFDNWCTEEAKNNSIIMPYLSELEKGALITFRFNGQFAHENQVLINSWDKYYSDNSGELIGRCMITGEIDAIAKTHPAIMKLYGAQSSGANLVSFNAPAYCSYDSDKNPSAHFAAIGKSTAFAYTSALNYLLADFERVQKIGNLTMLCWADNADPNYADFQISALFGETSAYSEDDLHAIAKRLAEGKPCNDFDPDMQYHVLGLVPNAARISVRFYWTGTFGNLIRNINAHHERMQIQGSKFSSMPVWAMMKAVTNQKQRDKTPNPHLSDAVTRAIYTGTDYPFALLQSVMLRISADRSVDWTKAAIIKGFYMKNKQYHFPKEALQVALNEECKDTAYVLGRLFAVYEQIQELANPGINTTIKDKFFSAAAATPSMIFPQLDMLAMKHLKKMNKRRVYFESKIGKIKALLPEQNPIRQTLHEQGAFVLGYYHEREARFTKTKEDDENGSN